jgi:hypothetical protein
MVVAILSVLFICFIYRRKQTLQKNKTLKKRTSYVLLYQRSCITNHLDGGPVVRAWD